jgi:hypothetical protein
MVTRPSTLWTPSVSLVDHRFSHQMVLLPGERILVVGGMQVMSMSPNGFSGNRSRPRLSSPPPVFWRNGSRTLPMPSSSPPGCAQRRRCIPALCANPVNGYDVV